MQHNISCIIIDDEPKMGDLLADRINSLYPDIEISAIYTNWKPALEHLRNTQPDILFTDISMPGKTGFDILDLVPNLSSEIIFVTAHTEFALDAFNFDVSGYVLKPVNDKVLVKTVDRAIGRIKAKRQSEHIINTGHQKIGVPDATGIHYVNLNDIIYCESQNRYTKVATLENEILSSYNIGKFQDTLQGEEFYQLHRSFIINLNHVKKYDSSGIVIMKDNTEIPVSRKHKDEFLAKFNRVKK